MKLEIIISQPSLSVKPSDSLNFDLTFGTFFKGETGDKGNKGDKGEVGDKGEPFTYSDFTIEQLTELKGETGEKGDKGEAANIVIGRVSSVESSEPATVENSGSNMAAIFNFNIPRGVDAVTPIRGTDYWTQADIDAINTASQTYIDQALYATSQTVLNLIAKI